MCVGLKEKPGQRLELGWSSPVGVFICPSQGMLVAVLGFTVGYHKLDFRATEVTQDHSVSGEEEMRARCASFKCEEKWATLSSLQ